MSSAVLPKRKRPWQKAAQGEPKRFASFKDYASFAISVAAFAISGWTAYYNTISERYQGTLTLSSAESLKFEKTAAGGLTSANEKNTVRLTFSNGGNQPFSIQSVRLTLRTRPPSEWPRDECWPEIDTSAINFTAFALDPGKLEIRQYILIGNEKVFPREYETLKEDKKTCRKSEDVECLLRLRLDYRRSGCLVVNLVAPNSELNGDIVVPLTFLSDIDDDGRLIFDAVLDSLPTQSLFTKESLIKRLFRWWKSSKALRRDD